MSLGRHQSRWPAQCIVYPKQAPAREHPPSYMSGPVPTYDVSYLPVNMDPSWDEQRGRQDHAAEPGTYTGKRRPFCTVARSKHTTTYTGVPRGLSFPLSCSVAFVVSPCTRRSLRHSHLTRPEKGFPGHHRGTCRVQPQRASMPAASSEDWIAVPAALSQHPHQTLGCL